MSSYRGRGSNYSRNSGENEEKRLHFINAPVKTGLSFPTPLGRPSTFVEKPVQNNRVKSQEEQESTYVGTIEKHTSRGISKATTSNFVPISNSLGSGRGYGVEYRQEKWEKEGFKSKQEYFSFKKATKYGGVVTTPTKTTTKIVAGNEEYEDTLDESEEIGEEEELFPETSVLETTPRTSNSSPVSIKSTSISTKSKTPVSLDLGEEDIISKYVSESRKNRDPKVSIELELRFSDISSVAAQAIRDKYDGNLIATTSYYNGQYRRFESAQGRKTVTSYERKDPIMSKKIDGFKVSLSKEEVLSSLPKDFLSEFRRERQRYRSIVGPHKEYYLDVTYVTTTKYRNGRLENDTRNEWEVELEIISDDNVPTLEEFIDFAKSLLANTEKESEISPAYGEMLKLIKVNNSSIYNILTKVKQLDESQYYQKFMPKDYYLTEKLDGERRLVYITNGKQYTFKNPSILVDEIDVPVTENYVFDCEFYHDKLFILDILYSNDKRTGNIVSRLADLPEYYKNSAKKYYLIDNLTALKEAVDVVYTNATNDVDGILFVTAGQTYASTEIYKWKPAQLQTIDFSMVLDKNVGNVYHYILCSNISKDIMGILGIKRHKAIKSQYHSKNYITVQFTPSLNPFAWQYTSTDPNLEGAIYEMRLNNGDWEIYKQRKDKTTPNDHKVAEDIYNKYFNPFTIEMLFEKSDTYFPTGDYENSQYKDYLSHMRYECANKLYWKEGFHLDLASGRGGDIHNYRRLGVSKILCVDSDKSAITELCDRKYSGSYGLINANTLIYAAIAKIGEVDLVELTSRYNSSVNDVNVPYTVESPLFDRITSNFGAHYFLTGPKEINSILNQVNILLKPEGSFIIVALNDKKVTKDINIGNGKYKINVLGDGYVDVLMPFNGKMMSEKLIDSDILRVAAKNNGFSYKELSISEGRLNRDDARYVSLHTIYHMTKL